MKEKSIFLITGWVRAIIPTTGVLNLVLICRKPRGLFVTPLWLSQLLLAEKAPTSPSSFHNTKFIQHRSNLKRKEKKKGKKNPRK